MEEPNLALPVLPRLDRLDRLVQLLEEKRCSSGRHPSNPAVAREMEQEEDQCKTLCSALEEVHHKGTLIERLTTLENRVLQLSIEMDDGNTSRSSSSTALVSENFGHDSVVPKVSRQSNNETPTNHETEYHPPPIQEDDSIEECKAEPKDGKRQKRKEYRKWFGLFRMGCN
ncbi:hypothetical protein LguiA_013832 [Lonicera macranthoides]